MCSDGVIDTLAVEVTSAANETLAGVEVIAIVAGVIGLEFVVEVPYALNVVAGVRIANAFSICAEENVSGLTAELTVLDFGLLSPSKKPLLSCWASFKCCLTTVFDCARILQACKPSCHVWPSFMPPVPPQFPNQEPPWPQQLILPDFFVTPHLGHTKLIIVVAAPAVCGHLSNK